MFGRGSVWGGGGQPVGHGQRGQGGKSVGGAGAGEERQGLEQAIGIADLGLLGRAAIEPAQGAVCEREGRVEAKSGVQQRGAANELPPLRLSRSGSRVQAVYNTVECSEWQRILPTGTCPHLNSSSLPDG